MNKKLIKQLVAAIILAMLVGLGFSTTSHAGADPNPSAITAVAKFYSVAKNDGGVREFSDDSWTGSQTTPGSQSIQIGDDYGRRLWYGILDFNTAPLPDTAVITGATLQVTVLDMYLKYGNPYTKLGNMYASITTPYFGLGQQLEARDFQAASLGAAGIFPQATRPTTKITLQITPGALGLISLTDRTQFKLYFLDDNNDSYPQGLAIASGNFSMAAYRPVLTITYNP